MQRYNGRISYPDASARTIHVTDAPTAPPAATCAQLCRLRWTRAQPINGSARKVSDQTGPNIQARKAAKPPTPPACRLIFQKEEMVIIVTPNAT